MSGATLYEAQLLKAPSCIPGEGLERHTMVKATSPQEAAERAAEVWLAHVLPSDLPEAPAEPLALRVAVLVAGHPHYFEVGAWLRMTVARPA